MLNSQDILRFLPLRNYNSRLEVADENDVPTESDESLSDQVKKVPSVIEPQNSEDLLLQMNKFEAPSAVPVDNDDSWGSDIGGNEKKDFNESDSSDGTIWLFLYFTVALESESAIRVCLNDQDRR